MTTRRNNMNKLIAKPKNSIYDMVKAAGGYTWLGEMEETVKEYVGKYYDFIKKEAEYDGNPMLADEEYLYTKFKENVYNGEWNANWEILKYFQINLKVKLLKFMYGAWEVTEQDKEMYDYFLNLEVNDDNKCKPARLKFKSGLEPDLFNAFTNERCAQMKFPVSYYIDWGDYDSRAEYPYFMICTNWVNSVSIISRNCKMLPVNKKDILSEPKFDYHLAQSARSWRILACGEEVKTKEEIRRESSHERTQLTMEISSMLFSNKEFVKLTTKLKKLSKKLLDDFIEKNKDRFDKLSDADKEKILLDFS